MAAQTVQITSRGKEAKIRNPWLVALFSIITLGIYYLVWYYKVNREMSDWGEENKTDIGLSPGVSLLAITLGSLIIIPPFVSAFHTGKRMQLSQRVADVHGGSGLLFFFLSIIPIVNFFAPVYLQTHLNKVWETRHLASTPSVAIEPPATPDVPVASETPTEAEPTPTEPEPTPVASGTPSAPDPTKVASAD